MEELGKDASQGTENKRCSRCGEVKPLDLFHKSASSKDGRVSYCMDCCPACQRKIKKKRAADSRKNAGKAPLKKKEEEITYSRADLVELCGEQRFRQYMEAGVLGPADVPAEKGKEDSARWGRKGLKDFWSQKGFDDQIIFAEATAGNLMRLVAIDPKTGIQGGKFWFRDILMILAKIRSFCTVKTSGTENFLEAFAQIRTIYNCKLKEMERRKDPLLHSGFEEKRILTEIINEFPSLVADYLSDDLRIK